MTFPRDESQAARAAGIELRLSECGESLETRDIESACPGIFSYFSSGANTRTLRAFACDSFLCVSTRRVCVSMSNGVFLSTSVEQRETM